MKLILVTQRKRLVNRRRLRENSGLINTWELRKPKTGASNNLINLTRNGNQPNKETQERYGTNKEQRVQNPDRHLPKMKD